MPGDSELIGDIGETRLARACEVASVERQHERLSLLVREPERVASGGRLGQRVRPVDVDGDALCDDGVVERRKFVVIGKPNPKLPHAVPGCFENDGVGVCEGCQYVRWLRGLLDAVQRASLDVVERMDGLDTRLFPHRRFERLRVHAGHP